MNPNSKYFDLIRISLRKARGEYNGGQPGFKSCEWKGCQGAATYRAPCGRGREDEYQWFCLDHVREYNRTYNYFLGMADDQVAAYQAANVTGHRPTWQVGGKSRIADRGYDPQAPNFSDPFSLFGANIGRQEAENDRLPRRPPRNAERKALRTLGLPDTASLNEIKSQYKEQVKRHHPDANGGDKSAEERLRNIIQAYQYLKKSGFC